MAPGGNNCRRIVRTIQGLATNGDDTVYVCADGTRWRKPEAYELDGSMTASPIIGYQHGGKICDHR